MSTTLPLFWDISSNTKSNRIEASVKLIKALENFQNVFSPPLAPSESSSDEDGERQGDEEDDDDRLQFPKVNLEKLNASDVTYSIRRLIRGLASPRESSRLGFAVALTELLARLNSVTASQILSLIMQHSHIHGAMKGQEERDMLFARLFGVTALAQSGLLFRSSPLANSSTPQCTLNEFINALEILLALSKKKSFLKEPSFWTIVLSLRILDSSAVEWKDTAFSHVIEKIFIEDKTWSPEKVAVLLILQNLNIKADWKTLLSPTFKNEDILSLYNLANLAKILKEVDIDIEDGVPASQPKSQTNWKPQLHFVWDVIFDIYFPPENVLSNIKHKASFPEFFKVVVDDSLLSATSSDGRKLWGFELFRLSLSKVSASDLPRLFTANFMRSWVNHLSKPDRYLHKAAKLVASSLPPVITSNPTAGFPIILQLLQTYNQFDRLTGTKTLESLLTAMDINGVEQYVQHLIELAQNPNTRNGDGDEDPTSIRTWVCHQFHILIRNGSIPQNDTWITDILHFLLLHGLYIIREKDEKSAYRSLHHLPVPAFSDEARRTCRSRLLTCLAELTSRTNVIKTHEKSIRCTGCALDGQPWVTKVLQQFIALEKDSKHVSRLNSGKSDLKLKDKSTKALASLAAVSSDKKNIKDGYELILSATLLHHFLGEDADNTEDIEVCVTNIERLLPKKSSPKKKKQEQTSDDPEPTPITALVDTLIGYLDKSTLYLRTIANQTFSLLTSLVDRESIDLILTQLERRDPTEEEEMEVDELPEESESDSQSENDDDDDSDSEDDPELRKKIQEAFGVNGVDVDADGIGGDSDSESNEEAMDDDQMFQLDEQLAEIFRSRSKTKGDVGAQREATHFKNRVLDLVDVYLRKEPTSEHTPVFILPLIRVLLGTGVDEKQLTDKVISVLRSRYGKTKDIPTSTGLSIVENTLQELHTIAKKASTTNVKDIIPVCNLYLVRVCFSLSNQNQDKSFVHRIYLESLKDFATRKTSPLQPNFFQEVFRRYPSIVWTIRKELLDLTQNAVNGYRIAQILNFLLLMFNQFSTLDADRDALIEFIGEFKSVSLNIISKACDTDSLNASQMKDVLKLIINVARQTKRIVDDETVLISAWDVAAFESLNEKLQNSKFKSSVAVTNTLRQISSLFNTQVSGSAENSKKRKAEESKESDQKITHKKKAKKLPDV
ncbi:hypothetical protein Clacol_006212 [Clathrus columnatus]|uniref:DNA polymerase V n=1 Tax=Clathrus columnatus TaxID=1419009 RepID=A0AAV5AFK7_9AGAM|nr:hypothetical protein Clacol_006212 [Clathrus columnatus]